MVVFVFAYNNGRQIRIKKKLYSTITVFMGMLVVDYCSSHSSYFNFIRGILEKER